MERQEPTQETKQASKKTAVDPIVMASAASVALSWYLFYVKGDREQGLFVGLWPPTLVAFASYFRGARIENMLESSSIAPTGVVTRVQEMLQEQT